VIRTSMGNPGPEQPVQVGRDGIGIIVQLSPGNPRRTPALGLQDAIALAIGLKGRCGAMRGATVKLNREALLPPETVDLKESPAQRQRRI
jgi:hypothetical protein